MSIHFILLFYLFDTPLNLVPQHMQQVWNFRVQLLGRLQLPKHHSKVKRVELFCSHLVGSFILGLLVLWLRISFRKEKQTSLCRFQKTKFLKIMVSMMKWGHTICHIREINNLQSRASHACLTSSTRPWNYKPCQ